MTVAFKSAIDDAVIAELRAITGDDDRVLDLFELVALSAGIEP